MKAPPNSPQPKTWQNALKGKARIGGDIFTTGLEWEASRGSSAASQVSRPGKSKQTGRERP